MKKIFEKKIIIAVIALSLTVAAVGSAVVFANSNLLGKNTTPTQSRNIISTKSTSITAEQAKEKALKESKSGQVIGFEQDTYLGKSVYEVTILDGQIEKEYKIDAQTGEILKVETKNLSIDYEDKQLANANPKIDIATAEKLAKGKYPNAVLKKLKLDIENGTLVYEAKFVEGINEIELKLDANTGEVIEHEIDTEND